jgi:hypothetical protein
LITLLASQMALSAAHPPFVSPLPSPLKHPPTSDPGYPSAKRQAPSSSFRHICFRCGSSGHYPAKCSATVTSAGQPIAPLAPGSKHANALLAANGKQFCFRWASSSSCSQGSSCPGAHLCSICGNHSHGAARCPSTA